mgnify:FL=1
MLDFWGAGCFFAAVFILLLKVNRLFLQNLVLTHLITYCVISSHKAKAPLLQGFRSFIQSITQHLL